RGEDRRLGEARNPPRVAGPAGVGGRPRPVPEGARLRPVLRRDAAHQPAHPRRPRPVQQAAGLQEVRRADEQGRPLREAGERGCAVTATEPAAPPAPRRRLASLLVVFALGAALVGYLRGIQSPPPLPRHDAPAPAAGPARPAPSYSELGGRRAAAPDAVGPFDPVVRT